MRKKSVRLASAALAACMMLSVLPVGAFALEPGADVENSVSAQEAAVTLSHEGGTIEAGHYIMEGGKYTGGFTIDTTGDVTIDITGDVNAELSTTFITVTQVGTLTINGSENGQNKKVEIAVQDWQCILDVGNSNQVILNGGDYEITTSAERFATAALSNQGADNVGTMELNNVSATSKDGDGVARGAAVTGIGLTVNGGTYKGYISTLGTSILNGCDVVGYTNAVYAGGGNTTINGGNYSITGIGTQYQDEEAEVVCVGDTYGSAVLTVNGGTFSTETKAPYTYGFGTRAPHYGGKGKTELVINEATIRNCYAGINRRQDIAGLSDTPVSITLGNVTFEDNTSEDNTSDVQFSYTESLFGVEIYVTFDRSFTDTGNIFVTIPSEGLKLTNETPGDNYQKDLKLVYTGEKPGNQFIGYGDYVIDWNPESGCRYLTSRENGKYYVNPISATMTVEDTEKRPYSQFLPGDKITLTADPAPQGKKISGWKVEKIASPDAEVMPNKGVIDFDPENPETATLTMPDYDVFVTAEYEDIQYYDIKAVNCTVNKTKAAMDDIVTAEPTEQPGKRFTGWKVTKMVGDENVDITEELRDASQNGLIAAELTMPAADVTIEAVFEDTSVPDPDKDPKVNVAHIVSVANGEVTAIDDTPVPGVGEKASPDIATAKEGQIVTVTADERLDGQLFMGWVVEGIDLKDAKQDGLKLTFTMPNNDVTLAANYEEAGFEPTEPVNTDTDDGSGVIGGVIIGSAIVVGAYEAGTGIYRVINMPGIPMPSNRIELAELIWEHAGKPEPQSTEFYGDISEDDTDWQKAARWAVEQDLMQDDEDDNEFHPYFPVSKLRTCLTWNAAKEKGLFDTDKTEE